MYFVSVELTTVTDYMMIPLTAAETKGSEHAALVGDISASVDRVVRKGMADSVANPLAKLVVNTARQVVAEPLQVGVGRGVCGLLVCYVCYVCLKTIHRVRSSSTVMVRSMVESCPRS